MDHVGTHVQPFLKHLSARDESRSPIARAPSNQVRTVLCYWIPIFSTQSSTPRAVHRYQQKPRYTLNWPALCTGKDPSDIQRTSET